jgi:hypothetical protein
MDFHNAPFEIKRAISSARLVGSQAEERLFDALYAYSAKLISCSELKAILASTVEIGNEFCLLSPSQTVS